MMEAVQTSETHNSLHGATTQETAIFIVTAMRTSSHINLNGFEKRILRRRVVPKRKEVIRRKIYTSQGFQEVV
jgi:hypothetical protein